MRSLFVDREYEFSVLNSFWNERPGFVIVYGRRRVGKTRLLIEFLRGRKGVYYLARLSSHRDNISGLARAVEQLVPGFGRGKRYESLDALLEDVVREGVELVVIDEFTYWVRVAPVVVSELQYFVDHILPNTNMLLIVCGSLVGVVERSVLGGGSPLYGRRTGTIKLEPLKPWYICCFLPNYTCIERTMVYGIVGGIPYYLRLFDPEKTLYDNLFSLFFTKHSILYNEVDFLLREEFRNPSTYSRILKAIAKGYDTLGKISDYTSIPKTHLTSYLDILERIGFIKYKRPLWSKRGYYRVSDYLLRFHYSIIDDLRELIETEQHDMVYRVFTKKLDEYMGLVFEDIVYDLIPLLVKKGVVKEFNRVGRILHKDIDIDLALVNDLEKTAYVIEVKWSRVNDLDVERIMDNLVEKATRIKTLEGYKIKPLVVARESVARKHRNKVVDLKALGI